MNPVEINRLSFNYAGAGRDVLAVDHFQVEEGEVVVIVGKSGGGKSTLVNCINGVIPHVFKGNNPSGVVVYGKMVKETPLSKLSTLVGTLLQDPETQVLNYTVEEEVAFGPENLCFPPDEIMRRVKEAMATAGISSLADRETYTLSGGELQRVALAAVLSMRPKMLIMDEPTSNIDPEGTAQIFETLTQLKGRSTLIIVEHKLERVLPFADRVVLVDKGRIVFDIRKNELVNHIDELAAAGVDVPEHYVYAKRFGIDPEDIEAIRKKIVSEGIKLSIPHRDNDGKLLMQASANVQAAGRVIVEADISLREKQILAIMGRNGAGKSTFLKAIMNFLDKDVVAESRLFIGGKDLSKSTIQERGKYIAFVPQSFDLMLINKSVEDEIAYSLKKRHDKNYKQKVEEFLNLFSLQPERKRDPLMLSVGQRRRVAMAAALSAGVKIAMLDEPTSGQDYYNKELIGKELQMLKGKGFSFIIVTHDAKFVYKYADWVVIINAGKKVQEGTPDEVFIDSSRYSIVPPTEYYLRHPELPISKIVKEVSYL
ncbi:MAG: ATP-binding cassette domain-containing protein [Nitrososphaerota archaeon]